MISPSAVLTSSLGTTLIGRSGSFASARAFARPLWSVTQSACMPRAAAVSTRDRGLFSESFDSRVWLCISTFQSRFVTLCTLLPAILNHSYLLYQKSGGIRNRDEKSEVRNQKSVFSF